MKQTLEAEHIKALQKYLSSFQAEKDKLNIEEDIQALEDIQEDDLVKEEEENTSEVLKAIRKRKGAIDW